MALYLKVAAAAVAMSLLHLPPAFAHHLMGGQVPSTAWQGLLSGLGHPVIGIDHLAFIVGVGLMSSLVGHIVLLPLLFVAGTVVGCFIHLQGLTLPWSEAGVGLTVAVAAAIVATRSRMAVGVLAPLFAVAGALHGYAYGESIVGAESAPLAAYIIGFGVVQYCIAVISGTTSRTVVGRNYLNETMAMRLAGGAISLVAAFALINVALSG